MTRFPRLTLLAGAVLPALLHAQAPQQSPLAPLPPALPRTRAPEPTKPAISANDLKTRLYIYADDSMLGRETGTIGNVKATDYIAAQVKKMGLKPAGENGTYFQTVPLVERGIAPSTGIRFDGQSLALGDEFIPTGQHPIDVKATPVIYGGRLGDAEQLTQAQMAGKIVVFARAAQEINRRSRPAIEGAVAVFVLTLDEIPEAARKGALKPHISRDEGQPPLLQPTGPVVMYLTTAAGAKLFTAPLDSLKLGAAGKNVDVNFSIITQPARYPGRNVVAIIPGSDSKLRNQYVAIGAHNDHIGTRAAPLDHDSLRAYNHTALISGADSRPIEPSAEQWAQINADLAKLRAVSPPRQDSVFNGADDDGSGTVSVLEIAEYFVAQKKKPKRSILFVWHTGEEKGLWGSEYFTDNPTVARDSIVAQLNIDMIGRGNASDIPGGGATYLQLIGSRRLSTELGDLIETVNKSPKNSLTFDYSLDANGHPQQIYCRSDHYSYARYGIPVTFFTTGLHPDYHQLTDEAEYIDYDHMARVATFIADVTQRVANLDHRPVVDRPKPDPRGQCVQ